jgi:chromate transporter
MSSSQPSILKLLLSFMRLGITAFGGPAMIAHISKMAVEKERWLTGFPFALVWPSAR